MENHERNLGLERVQHQLRADGFRDTPNPLRSGVHSRGYLPHVKREGASYFVTIRLADSLPQEVLLQFKQQQAEQSRKLPNVATVLASGGLAVGFGVGRMGGAGGLTIRDTADYQSALHSRLGLDAGGADS